MVDSKKIPILFMSDWGDTGFGTVGKQLCSRLGEMEVFDVHYLGWFSKPHDIQWAQDNHVILHNTQFWDSGDHFGNKSFTPAIESIKPRVVLTLGDPWMVDHVQECQYRSGFMWVAYVPIDRDYLSRSWRRSLRRPDVLVLYSQFGMDVVKEMIPFRTPHLILHGVDRMCFKPWFPPEMDEDTPIDELMHRRKHITLGEKFADKWIVGFVGRNQVRKAIPRMFRAFRAFNCATWCEKQSVEVLDENDKKKESYSADEFCGKKQMFRCDLCPAYQQRKETENSVMYLHTTRGDGKDDPNDRPGIGWLIDELAERYNMQGRVGMTPKITSLKGVEREALAQIMGCFDVHLFMSHSEGFGLPVAETLACGTPNIVTNYSSMPELLSDGGGMLVDVHDYDTFTTWENDWAHASIGHAADCINKLFLDKELYVQMRKDAAASRYTPTWDEVAQQFRDLLFTAARY